MIAGAVAVPGPPAIFREEQSFGWWIYAAVALLSVVGLGFQGRAAPPRGPAWSLELPLVVAVGVGLPAVLVIGVLRLTTAVRPGEVRVWFGWVPSYRRSIALGSVKSVEVVRYRPIRDYKGWGVRPGPGGELALTARGNRGVRLDFDDGHLILIGSQQAEALARAIEQAVVASG